MDHFIDVLNSINDNYISKPRQEFLLLIKKNLDVIDKDKVKIKKKFTFYFFFSMFLPYVSCHVIFHCFFSSKNYFYTE